MTLAAVSAVFAMLLPFFATGAHAADETFAAFLAGIRREAMAAPYNVSAATFDRAFRGVEPDLSLPDLVIPGRPAPKSSGQAEFVKPPQAYLDRAYLQKLAEDGRVLATRHAAALKKIEDEIGVDRNVVLAIWGRETAFGTYRLPHYAIRVLATQAYLGRRKDIFRTELLYGLKMLEDGVVTAETMRSSWAGAMGLTQVMPSEFYQSARGLDGGKPDLFHSVPDALASAAEQLRQKGWVKGLPWGIEVAVPKGADCGLEGPAQARPFAQWSQLGFMPTRDRPLPADLAAVDAYLMSPGGAFGPSFLVTENYKVIRRYNMSDLYATFVGHLADRIAGGGDFHTPWKAFEPVAESDVALIQRQLERRGHAVEKIDGKVGSNTRMLIGAYQRQNGLTVDCWPTRSLLQHMTASTGGKP